MAPIASNLIFCTRRSDRFIEDPITNFGCLPVAVAQANNIWQGIKDIDNKVIKGSRGASDIMTGANATANGVANTAANVTKGTKSISNMTKVLNFASRNVNPLICVAGGIKVLAAKDEDKPKVLLEEATSLGFMFSAEGLFKKNKEGIEKVLRLDKATNWVDNKVAPKIGQTISEKCGQLGKSFMGSKLLKSHCLKGTAGTVISGILFALTSISGYMLGNKLAKNATKSLEEKHNKNAVQNNSQEMIAKNSNETQSLNENKTQNPEIPQLPAPVIAKSETNMLKEDNETLKINA